MIKSVNKLVLEINNTENQYFEKVILFVRPDQIETNNLQLQENAKQFLKTVNCNQRKKEPHILNKIPIGITLAGAVGAGAAVMGVIMAVARPF